MRSKKRFPGRRRMRAVFLFSKELPYLPAVQLGRIGAGVGVVFAERACEVVVAVERGACDLGCTRRNRRLRLHRSVRYHLELRSRRSRCRIPCPRCYDLRSVETVPHCRSSRILCGIPFPGEHRGFHRACKPRIVQEYLQHDAVYRIHDYSCVYIQEFPGTESGGYSV